MISQNVLNLVDTAMVGTLGTQALASAGLGSFLNFFCAALIMGLAVGVQVQCARLRGAGDSQYAIPLNAGLILSIVISAPLTVILINLTPTLMSWVTDHPLIAQEGGEYLEARLLGLIAIGINFAFRSYWSAVERASIYLITLIAMHCCNIFCNWLFIFGNLGAPELGVGGAGLASALSMWLGVLIYLGFALRHALPHGFLRGLPSREAWLDLLKMSLPSGIERMLFALGMTVFMTMIGWIGETELAASNIMINLFLVAILPALGFGLASATFVAKSIGAQTPLEARDWRRDISRWSLGTLLTIGAIFFLYSSEIIALFTADPAPAQLAHSVLILLIFFLPAEAFNMVLFQSLLGLGDNRMMLMINLSLQWGVSLPLVYLFGVSWGWGLIWVWGVHLGVRILGLLCYALRWKLVMGRLECHAEEIR